MGHIEKFQEALKIKTFLHSEDKTTENTLLGFQEFLFNNFPFFHKTAERRVLSPYSVVYRLPGAASGAALFLAHYDVVPAESGKWSVDPFGAQIKDGFIYGRGSLDMKNTLINIMEAAENLCAQSWKPKKDLWFVFGGDEERSGILGAMKTAQWFREKGQFFDWILDEGTPVSENQIKGINTPLALVSIEEKGYLSLNLTVKQEPGHASRPPKIQAAAVLGRALCRIAKKPFPFKLCATVEEFFKQVSVFMPGIQGIAMRYARALGPLFFKLAAKNPTLESMMRTTVAMTQLEGSAADNVMPSEVRAVINLRLLKPWTTQTATAYIKKAINDERVQISEYGLGTDPVSVGEKSDYRNNGWNGIENAMKEAWPSVPLLPFLMVATTDSRHFKDISNNIFRFNPYKLDPDELNTIHGHDERISIENLNRGLKFYTALMRLL
ncbi:MAG: M20/M25/M40 family metallo-hydrolase [Treponema sp.]|nr:M20/M25/M40 family metallo-hydrolase [Treponema sp.]MCL2272231.1 M20/M25/M40 family metallo-hydrolase [Treponema sp.]